MTSVRDPERWRWTWVLAVGLLLLHGGLAVNSLWQKAVTYDELSHLPAGLAFVTTGKMELNRQHPPLVKLLAGAAASTTDPELELDGDICRAGNEWRYGRRVLFEMGNDHLAMLRLGRLPTVVLSMLGGLVVFLWSRRRFGDGGGLFSLGLYAAAPTVLAHARWVTMDAAVSTGVVTVLYLWWRFQCARPFDAPATPTTPADTRRLLLTGLALGLALSAKFSALILLPAMVLTELAAHAPSTRLWQHWRRRLHAWSTVLVVALVTLQLTYLGTGPPLRYFADVFRINADRVPGYAYYLSGEFSPEGFPHYFLVAMAVKTALPGLLAMFAALVLAVFRARQHRAAPSVWRDDIFLWLPAVLWLGVTSAFAANLGVRYVLPVYPLLFVLAGALVPWLRQRGGRFGALVPSLLVVAQIATAAAVHPHYLPFFNRAAGGVQAGPAWLDDSNLDWGQDLLLLPAWLRQQGIDEPVRLLPVGHAVPEFYGLRRQLFDKQSWEGTPRPAVYVVSAHQLVRGVERARREGVHTDWLLRYRPDAVLGGSLYLYVFTGEAPARPIPNLP